MIFPISPDWQMKRVDEAAREAGLSIVRSRPIVFREGEDPLLGLFGMVKREHLPESYRDQTWKEPPLVIRSSDGSTHPEHNAIKLSIGFHPT